ncbi:MAG TPA: hypothetical protein VK465_15190, partial [Fibrobacteria bacterium]|nr:hypothetical protein [Fibrobacteria bacterium]
TWGQAGPLRFHNGLLEDLRVRFTYPARVQLPDMPGFLPAHTEGEMRFLGRHVFHLDAALKEQPLFAHLETLRALVARCADRRIGYDEFLPELGRIPIPVDWRNEIVNGLFEHAHSAPAAPSGAAGRVRKDLDALMDMFQDSAAGGTAVNPHLGRFLEEVGKDSTGFTLRDGAARALAADIDKTLATLRGSVLRQAPIAEALGVLYSLNRLARLARGRERQTVHVWTDIPEDPATLLTADADGSDPDAAVALVLLDPLERDPSFLRQLGGLAARLRAPLILQLPGEEIPTENPALEALAEGLGAHASHAYFFAGGVVSLVGDDAFVLRPAALAFLEGLVAGREAMAFYLHRAMKLDDQDIVTEKGLAHSTDRLLDQAHIDSLSERRVNRVNGARNRPEAAFPPLRPWSGT